MSNRRLRMVVAFVAATLVLGMSLTAPPPLARGLAVRFGAKADRARRGRPRKFMRPSRSVTLTLPEDVIDALRSVDSDLSRAVVRTVQKRRGRSPAPPAELVSYGSRDVIVVPNTRAFRERTEIELIPLPDGRALIAFETTLSVPQLELSLGDALADPGLTGEDRSTFEALAAILRRTRQDAAVAVQHRNIIVLRKTRRAGDAVRG